MPSPPSPESVSLWNTMFQVSERPVDKVFDWKSDGRRWLVKVYSSPLKQAARQREAEAQLLRLWAQQSLRVPEVSDVNVPGITRPHLITSRVEGHSLQAVLSSTDHPVTERLAVLSAVFTGNAERHRLALTERDARLVMIGSNTAKFLWTGDAIVHIDLEAGPVSESLELLAGTEVAQLLRCSARDMGRAHLDAVVGRAWEAYRRVGLERLPLLATRRTLDRPFQAYHRWVDRRHRDPRDVTKYDVVDAVARAAAASN